MPRLSVYIPDDLDLAIRTFPGKINVSRVCAAALRAHLAAKDDVDGPAALFHSFFQILKWNELVILRGHRGLRWVVSVKEEYEGENPAAAVAECTSRFLNRTFFDGCNVGFGGGPHLSDVVRRLEPRNLGMDLWALGYGHVDAEQPHVHPNALVTLLSMLYAPRSKPHLVGASLDRAWHWPTLYRGDQHLAKRFVVGSCATFDADSAHARVLGKEIIDFLVEENVIGDFLGVFLTPDGRTVEPYTKGATVSHIGSADLRELARRDDTIVLLTTAGRHKLRLLRAILAAGLCNAMILDRETAFALEAAENQPA